MKSRTCCDLTLKISNKNNTKYVESNLIILSITRWTSLQKAVRSCAKQSIVFNIGSFRLTRMKESLQLWRKTLSIQRNAFMRAARAFLRHYYNNYFYRLLWLDTSIISRVRNRLWYCTDSEKIRATVCFDFSMV